jgi:uncharacterized membrane protein YesL
MRGALHVFGLAFRDVWDDLWTNLVINLIWLCFQLLVITGPPATLGLMNYANRVANEEVAGFDDFWHGMRRYFFSSWRWALINYFILALLVGDYLLTGRFRGSSIVQIFQGFYLVVLAVWLLVQLYALPFLIEQNSPDVLQAIRNGAVMLGRNIRFSVVLGFLLIIVLLVGIPVFMLSVALGGMLIALAGNHAVLDRLQSNRMVEQVPNRRDPAQAAEQHRSP